MRIHLIAIGGSVMHNLALELKALGHEVTGSDDEIYEPAKSRLAAQGLLPEATGWNADLITPDIELIILGMHAQVDNPELRKAQELDITVQSFPRFVAEHIRDKKKIVVTGSHGKTTTTSMIMHVLRQLDYDFDYLVGAQLPGFDRMVRLSHTAKIAVIEGDEYLSSRINPMPKMLEYHGDIVITTGVAWDHINVFPTYNAYIAQFRKLFKQIDNDGVLIHYIHDKNLNKVLKPLKVKQKLPYGVLKTQANCVIFDNAFYPISIFGKHNLENMNAARLACNQLGISNHDFLTAIKDFSGSGKRLELMQKDPTVYKDFAHAPSKAKATVAAIREKYPNKKILAVLELHTYSSLNKEFIPFYKQTLNQADRAIVLFDPKALEMKRLDSLSTKFVKHSFAHQDLEVFDNVTAFEAHLKQQVGEFDVYLLMSSGHFGGLDMKLIFN